MEQEKIIFDTKRFSLTIQRLCHELIENHNNFEKTCIIGIQERGVLFANRIYDYLSEMLPHIDIEYGKIDTTFFRDDFRRGSGFLKASETIMPFLVEGKKVILIDDVLFTGRTINAALTALMQYGRPTKVELVSLIDRKFNRDIPIATDYVGMTIDTMDESYVKVIWNPDGTENKVLLLSHKNVKSSYE